MPKQKSLKEQGITHNEMKKLMKIAHSKNAPVKMLSIKTKKK